MSEIDDAMRRYPTITKQLRAHEYDPVTSALLVSIKSIWDGYDEIARLRAENERLRAALVSSRRWLRRMGYSDDVGYARIDRALAQEDGDGRG